MNSDTKLYDIIGVSKDASDKDIKKAYRKLAIKHHPDKNLDNKEEAEKKFKEISEAYSILSDPEKRQKYDQFGMAGVREDGGEGVDPRDIFAQFFGGGSPFGGSPFGGSPFGGSPFGGSPFGGGRKQSEDNLIVNLPLTLEQMYNGGETTVKYKIKIGCNICNETGSKSKQKSKCDNCGGKGKVVMIKRMGPMAQQIVTNCPKCNGQGVIKPKDPCEKCNGKGFNIVDKNIKIPIRKNISDGQKIIVDNKGHQINGKKGKLILNTSVIPHKIFQREDDNLICQVNLNLAQAVCGFIKTIKFLDGKEIYLKYTEPINHEEVKIIPNMGFNYGALIIKFNINTDEPLNLSNEDRSVIKKLLSSSKKNKLELENELKLENEFEKNKKKYHISHMVSIDNFRRSQQNRHTESHEHTQNGPSDCQVS